MRASSWAGMPSVMHTMNGMPALRPPRGWRRRRKRGGTDDERRASAPVAATASATESKTGMPSTSCRPCPG